MYQNYDALFHLYDVHIDPILQHAATAFWFSFNSLFPAVTICNANIEKKAKASGVPALEGRTTLSTSQYGYVCIQTCCCGSCNVMDILPALTPTQLSGTVSQVYSESHWTDTATYKEIPHFFIFCSPMSAFQNLSDRKFNDVLQDRWRKLQDCNIITLRVNDNFLVADRAKHDYYR